MFKEGCRDWAGQYQGSLVLLTSFLVIPPGLLKMNLVLGRVMNICGSCSSGWILKSNIIFLNYPLASVSFVLLFPSISPENQVEYWHVICTDLIFAKLHPSRYFFFIYLVCNSISFLLLLLLSRTLPTHHSVTPICLKRKTKLCKTATWSMCYYSFPSPFFGENICTFSNNIYLSTVNTVFDDCVIMKSNLIISFSIIDL